MKNRIANLYVGQEIKDYPQLCKLLNEKQKEGKSRILQHKEWERFFRYKKDKRKYLIEEVYTDQNPKIDLRKNGNNNNSIYGEVVQKLVLYLLSQKGGISHEVLSYYLKYFGMVNVNFEICEDQIPSFASYIGIDEYYVYEFYYLVRGNLRDVFETALNALQKKEYISWSKVPMVCVRSTEEDLMGVRRDNTSSNNSNTYVYSPPIYRVASKEEIKLVEDTERKLLEKMGYKNKQHLLFSGEMHTFRKHLRRALLDKANIYYLYHNYKIIQSRTIDDEELSNSVYSELRITLNNILVSNILQNAKKRHSEVVEKYSSIWGEKPFTNKKDRYRHNECYVDVYTRIVSHLISGNAEDMKDKLKSQKNKVEVVEEKMEQ